MTNTLTHNPTTSTAHTGRPTSRKRWARLPARKPAAVALYPSVAAVRDSLAHMETDAILEVPIGTPHENFDVVEWCANNGKRVINRYDPWPLKSLMVENTRTGL